MSGVVFVLFALSLNLDILHTDMNTWIYFIFGILYLASLFIIAGIDKDRTYIQKSVLLFGFIIQTIYIIYLYIVENNFNIYRYVIYLSIICILMLIDIFILRKKAKEITEVTPRIQELIDDMFETMYDADGVGLAAPQVGIRKRLVVIDCGEEPLVLINPVILETSGEQTGQEGCLSVPNKVGIVTRPNYAKVKAYDENMQEYIIEGTELLARCLCHEIDHLDGVMYVDKATEMMQIDKEDDEA